MPLQKKATRAAFEANLHTLLAEHRPIRQALAIDYSVTGRGKDKRRKPKTVKK